MKKQILRRLARFLRPYALWLALALALTVLSSLLALAAPLLSGRAVDAVGVVPGAVDFPGVFRACGGMLACYALSSGLNYAVAARLIKVGQSVSRDLRRAAFDRMSELPVEYFDTHPAGDLVSRVCYDVDTVNAVISTDLLHLCTSALTVGGSFVMLLAISPRLTLVFFVTVPLSLFLTRFQMRRIHPLFRLRSKALGSLNGFSEERVGRQRAIRAYGVEAADLEQFQRYNAAASEAYYEADRASASLGPSVNFINNLSLAAVSMFGALLYLGGGLTLGNLSSFVLYSRKFSSPIREAANLLSELQSSVAAAERVLDLLDEPAEAGDAPGAREPETLRGEISFAHVDFGYDPARPVLRDFTAHIPPGSLAAVVGPTGAGKTTLVSLLLRFYRPQGGSGSRLWRPPGPPGSTASSPLCRRGTTRSSPTRGPGSPKASGSCWPSPGAFSPTRTSSFWTRPPAAWTRRRRGRSAVRRADRILVLDQGGVAEAGTHEELLAAGGLYASLYRAAE